jgi:hypothetical protein
MPDNTQGGGTPPATPGQQSGTPAGQSATQQGATQGQGETPATWDDALAAMPEPVKALYEAHTTGLKNTVTAVRGERDTLSSQLTALTKALGKDTPDAAKQLLAEMTGQLEASNRRAAFYEEAGQAGIGCTNPKAAFALAQADGLFDGRGNVNWQALKTAAPELFRVKAPDGNAGAGTGNPPPAAKNFNAFIRAAAGRS